MFGYGSEAELVGNNVKMLVPPAHVANHDHYVENFLEHGNERIVRE